MLFGRPVLGVGLPCSAQFVCGVVHVCGFFSVIDSFSPMFKHLVLRHGQGRGVVFVCYISMGADARLVRLVTS